MTSEAKFIPDMELFACPFNSTCKLPKIQFLCRIPECKQCTEYLAFLKKLDARFLY